jgi:hypothetical protein
MKVSHSRIMEKIPKTKDEIQRLIIAELRTFAQCEKAWGIVVVPIVDDTGVATWTVSRFHRGQSNAYACDRALQRIVSLSLLKISTGLTEAGDFDEPAVPSRTW